ncbi:MAG: ABC transporter ATP-binding protein [Holosporales bacterium]|jgi:ABC-2 type transport system ATP-binding protein|nr:ABC transporter ATP-binding protein [Holosporales bacterium]
MPEIGFNVEALSRRFGEVVALDECTLNFSSGIIHGIIGPEGAGKTTLLRTLLGLLDVKSGTVAYSKDGKSTTLSEIRDDIAYMPETQSLYGDLSVEEHLLFFKDMYGMSNAEYNVRSKDLLALTRLEGFKDRPASKLSGGMYKKLGLMCALLRSPSAILLDEPTNGVDPISRREFWSLLYDLKKSTAITILMATAYMDEAERCMSVHLLANGRVIAEGEPRALLAQFQSPDFNTLFITKMKSLE